MVLVLATDGSENARFAVDYLLRYPILKSSKVYCCSVYSPVSAVTATAHPFLGGILGDRIAEAIESAREQAVAASGEAAEKLSSAGFDAEAVTLEGDPAGRISEFAEEKEAQLTVFGAVGVSAVEEYLMGSVARALLHHSKNSILVVKRNEFSQREGLRAIYATDLSEESAKTRDLVPILAPGKFESLDIVTVATDLKAIQALEATRIVSDENLGLEDPEKAVIQWYEDRLKQVEEDIVTAAKVFRRVVLQGDPRKVLVDYARESSSDLLICGARSHSMLSRIFLGSVSEHLVYRAHCSVLVIRP